MRFKLNANAMVLNKEGKVLCLKLSTGQYKGETTFPGGGVDIGETGTAAVKREIKEETGIDAYDLAPMGFCELISEKLKGHRIVLIFKGKAEGEPQLTEEGEGMWLSIDEVKKIGMPFAQECIKILEGNQIHFKLDDDNTSWYHNK